MSCNEALASPDEPIYEEAIEVITKERQTYGFLGVAAIMSLMALNAENGIINPALDAIGAMFPGIASGTISLLSTLPSLTMLPFSILAGSIAGKRVKYKTLAVIGLFLATFSNIACFFVADFGVLLGLRAVFGVGFGLITALGNPLIVQGYEGEQRTKFMGLGTAFWYGGSVLFYLLAGVVAAYSPMATFLIYAIGIVPLLLTIFFLPEPPKASQKAGEAQCAKDSQCIQNGGETNDIGNSLLISSKEGKGGSTSAIPKEVVMLGIFLFSLGLAFGPFLIGMSFVLSEKGISDPAFAGVVLMINSVGGIFAGMFMNKFVSGFKRYSLTVIFLLLGLMLVALSVFNNEVAILVVSLIAGFCFAMPIGVCNLTLGNLVSSDRVAFLSNVLFVFFNIGGFASSFWITAWESIYGGMSAVLIAGSVVLVVMGLVCAILKSRGMMIGNAKPGEEI